MPCKFLETHSYSAIILDLHEEAFYFRNWKLLSEGEGYFKIEPLR